jgi:diguanylate cyclase (GGDEF)-like protein
VIKDNEGRVERVVVVSHDVTERKQTEFLVHQMAYQDTLTKVPNRRLLDDRLSQSMALSARSGCYGALMFLDLDNFKSLNDASGHAVGDSLLIEAAGRLRRCVREMDTVARIGGDEFVVMLSELNVARDASISEARAVAEKIRAALSEPYLLSIQRKSESETTVEHQCTVSIGVALFINHDVTPSDILKGADRAMYQAKDAGRNVIRFYE